MYANLWATVSAVVKNAQKYFDGKSYCKNEHNTEGNKESDFKAVSEVNEDGCDNYVPKYQLCHIQKFNDCPCLHYFVIFFGCLMRIQTFGTPWYIIDSTQCVGIEENEVSGSVEKKSKYAEEDLTGERKFAKEKSVDKDGQNIKSDDQ
jgi:hypothetical protein